jgi:hypothetical protein
MPSGAAIEITPLGHIQFQSGGGDNMVPLRGILEMFAKGKRHGEGRLGWRPGNLLLCCSARFLGLPGRDTHRQEQAEGSQARPESAGVSSRLQELSILSPTRLPEMRRVRRALHDPLQAGGAGLPGLRTTGYSHSELIASRRSVSRDFRRAARAFTPGSKKPVRSSAGERIRKVKG